MWHFLNNRCTSYVSGSTHSVGQSLVLFIFAVWVYDLKPSRASFSLLFLIILPLQSYFTNFCLHILPDEAWNHSLIPKRGKKRKSLLGYWMSLHFTYTYICRELTFWQNFIKILKCFHLSVTFYSLCNTGSTYFCLRPILQILYFL